SLQDFTTTSKLDNVKEHFRQLMRIWRESPLIKLSPLMLLIALATVLSYVILPNVIIISVGSGADYIIAVYFLFYGICTTIGSCGWGIIYDKLGYKVVLLLTELFFVAQLLLLYWAFFNPPDTWWYWGALGTLAGLADT